MLLVVEAARGQVGRHYVSNASCLMRPHTAKSTRYSSLSPLMNYGGASLPVGDLREGTTPRNDKDS